MIFALLNIPLALPLFPWPPDPALSHHSSLSLSFHRACDAWHHLLLPVLMTSCRATLSVCSSPGENPLASLSGFLTHCTAHLLWALVDAVPLSWWFCPPCSQLCPQPLALCVCLPSRGLPSHPTKVVFFSFFLKTELFFLHSVNTTRQSFRVGCCSPPPWLRRFCFGPVPH